MLCFSKEQKPCVFSEFVFFFKYFMYYFLFNVFKIMFLLILNLKLGLTSKRTKEIKILLYKQPKMMCDLILFYINIIIRVLGQLVSITNS